MLWKWRIFAIFCAKRSSARSDAIFQSFQGEIFNSSPTCFLFIYTLAYSGHRSAPRDVHHHVVLVCIVFTENLLSAVPWCHTSCMPCHRAPAVAVVSVGVRGHVAADWRRV